MSGRAAPSPGLALLIAPEREEASQWRRFMASRDAALRERLFDRYCRIAKAMARRHSRKMGVSADRRDDLEQAACHGLLEAIDRFDPLRGVPFAAFARPRIEGSIVEGLARLSESGAQMRFRARVERERMASLAEGSGSNRSATQELADLVAELALGLMLEREAAIAHPAPVGNPDNSFDSLAWRETQAVLGQRVDELPEPERTVIRQHYRNDLLFSEIATMLGLSRGRVSQLHRSALVRLRKAMRTVR